MREYWLLSKLQLSSLYGINQMRHARDDVAKKKARRSITALAAMVFGLGWASTFYSLALSAAFAAAGTMESLLGIMAAASGALVLLFTVFETKSVLFKAGDFDTVMSWPVRVSAVVAARVTVMYVYNLVYALLLMLPAGVIYAVRTQPPLWFYPVYLIGMLLIPGLPTVIGTLLGTLVTALTARMKRPGVMGSVFQILLAFGVMAFSMTMTNGMDSLAEKAAGLGDAVGRVYPPAEWLMRAARGDCLALLMSAAATVCALLVLTQLLSRRFVELHGLLLAVPHKKSKRDMRLRAAGKVRALYRVEWNRYVGSSLYLANTAFGYVMLLALAVVLGVLKLPVVEEIFADPAYPAMRTAIPLIAALLATMSATTGSAISMEGKRLWIVKSLPVRMHEWLTAKLLVSLTLAVPSIVLFALITGLGMRFSGREWLYALLTPLAFALLSGVFGLAVNLRLPKLDWTNEAEVVKQSAATMICVFAGMFAAGVPLGVLIATGSAAVLPVSTGLALLLSAWLYRLLSAKGEKRLYDL